MLRQPGDTTAPCCQTHGTMFETTMFSQDDAAPCLDSQGTHGTMLQNTRQQFATTMFSQEDPAPCSDKQGTHGTMLPNTWHHVAEHTAPSSDSQGTHGTIFGNVGHHFETMFKTIFFTMLPNHFFVRFYHFFEGDLGPTMFPKTAHELSVKYITVQ